MAAPSATVRQVPSGFFLVNGYQSLITFALNPDVELWEKVVTPPGLSLGEKIDVTTQHNKYVRTAAPRHLVEIKDGKFTCSYDPLFYDSYRALLGHNTTITQTFPDGSTLAWYGFMSDFEPDGQEEGKQPEATITIKATNRDPNSNTGGPESGSGTGTAYDTNEWYPVYHAAS